MTEPVRPQDLLREMRRAVASVAEPVVAEQRERAVVARMRRKQALELERLARRTRWRRRILAAAVALLPSGALAAVWYGTRAPEARGSVQVEAAPRLTVPSHSARAVVPPAVTRPATERAAEFVAESAAERPTEAATVTAEAALTPPLGRHRSSATTAKRDAPADVAHAAAATFADPAANGTLTPAESTLVAENALLQSALVAAHRGNDERAIRLLDELLTRYPASPLSQTARVQRLRASARLHANAPEPSDP